VSTTACRGCTRPVPDAYLCTDCADQLRDTLYSVGQLVDDLEIALCRMARIAPDGAGIRVRGADTPLAFNWAASEALWLLHTTLTDWATTLAKANASPLILGLSLNPVDPKDPARIFPGRGRIAGLAAWLVERMDWVRAHPDAGELDEQIRYTINTGRATIDRPAERAYAGPCGEDTDDGPCPTDLYAPPGARLARCRGCGAEHDMAARREWLLATARDQLVSAPDASRALPALLGKPVTASAIRGLAHRGRLQQHRGSEHGLCDAAGRRVPLYRLGDIVDVVVAVEAEQAAKRNGKKAG
jgi:hypothetical protein